MKILGLVPARAGSKSIPHKNIKDLNGKPLMYYAIQNMVDVLGECFVSTDPEVFTFAQVDDTLVLMWTGTEWITIANSGAAV